MGGTENSGDTGSTNKARCRQKCEKKETGAEMDDCKSKCESATEKSPTKGTEKSATKKTSGDTPPESVEMRRSRENSVEARRMMSQKTCFTECMTASLA